MLVMPLNLVPKTNGVSGFIVCMICMDKHIVQKCL